MHIKCTAYRLHTYYYTLQSYRRLTFQLYVTQCTQKEGVLHPSTAPSDSWTSPVRRRWFCVKKIYVVFGDSLGVLFLLALRGPNPAAEGIPLVPSARPPSPDRKVQTSGRTSSNKSAPRTYIVASAKNGK